MLLEIIHDYKYERNEYGVVPFDQK